MNLMRTMETLYDIAAYQEAKKRLEAGEETFPGEFVERELEARMKGQSRIPVWREYRGMKQAELAEKAGVSRIFLSDIERGKKSGSIKTLKAIAKALKCDMDDLA